MKLMEVAYSGSCLHWNIQYSEELNAVIKTSVAFDSY